MFIKYILWTKVLTLFRDYICKRQLLLIDSKRAQPIKYRRSLQDMLIHHFPPLAILPPAILSECCI